MNAPKHTRLIDALAESGISYEENVLLSGHTTFRLGGATPCLIRCEGPDQLIDVVQMLSDCDLDHVLIGDGSNLLISDQGLPVPVIKYSTETPSIRLDGDQILVSGSTSLDALAAFAVDKGVAEFVNCSGIPGTVGGAIVGNAGAFGWQIGDALATARLIAEDGTVVTAGHHDFKFEYRHSRLKDSREIVLDAIFDVERGDRAEFIEERARILALRKSKHPDLSVDSCAGSFFKNIEPTSAAGRRQAAGWFLDEVNAKDMVVGGAAVYVKHANILIKQDAGCVAQHVLDLSRKMASAVRDKFDIELQREVRLLGKFV